MGNYDESYPVAGLQFVNLKWEMLTVKATQQLRSKYESSKIDNGSDFNGSMIQKLMTKFTILFFKKLKLINFPRAKEKKEKFLNWNKKLNIWSTLWWITGFWSLNSILSISKLIPRSSDVGSAKDLEENIEEKKNLKAP